MAPLGVLTAVVAAIRVSGPDWLKRLIGRARENIAAAEIELMSSVSQEVCEVWNGNSIIRSMGSPQIKQIIHLPAYEGDISPASFITMNPGTWSEGYELKDWDPSTKSKDYEKSPKESPAKVPKQPLEKSTAISTSVDAGFVNEGDNVDIESSFSEDILRAVEFTEMPPNISLNIHGGSDPIELIMSALVAAILQVAVLVWSGFLAYSSFAKRHRLIGSKVLLGFLLQAAGTVLLALSLFLCARIIDNSSCERKWSREGETQIGRRFEFFSCANSTFQALLSKLGLAKDNSFEGKAFHRRDMQIYWVQKQHTVGDNTFDPYILYAKERNDKVHESHRAKFNSQNDEDRDFVQRQSMVISFKKVSSFFDHHLTTFAAGMGVLGFVAQFQGLRFSNWTCSVAQLIALGIATVLRALVRRGMTETPVAVKANNDYLLDYFTLAIVGGKSKDSEFPNPEAFRSPGLFFAFGVAPAPKLRAITEPESDNQAQPQSVCSSRENSEHANLGLQPSTNPQFSTKVGKKPNLAQQALNLRVRLGLITKWKGPNSQEAINLSNSIETALETLDPQLPAKFGKKCAVVLPVDMRNAWPTSMPSSRKEISSQVEVELYIVREGGKWKVDDAQLEAFLSLISYSAWAAEQKKGNQRSKKEKIRFGKSNPTLLSDIFWWVSDMDRSLQKVKIIDNCKENRALSASIPLVDDQAKSYRIIERPALGSYINDSISEENDGTVGQTRAALNSARWYTRISLEDFLILEFQKFHNSKATDLKLLFKNFKI
ncbi:MAG: hypothetical protein Q9167_003547 [Letrouitia subvulpina]